MAIPEESFQWASRLFDPTRTHEKPVVIENFEAGMLEEKFGIGFRQLSEGIV